MTHLVADRVRETTTTTGTGNVTLAGAASGAWRPLSAVLANNDTTWYCIAHQSAAEWEVGLGTWQTGGILVRTAVLESSNANALVNFSSGVKDVFIVAPAERAVVLDNNLALTLPGVSAIPAAPAAGNLSLYARNRAGRMFPEMIGPSGIDSSLQPALFGNNITMWLPGSGTTAAISFGTAWTVAATQAHPSIANTNFMTQLRRATFTTTTTAGNAAGVRGAAPACWRGNAAGLGGFFYFSRFGVLTFNAGMQIWNGLSGVTGLLAGEPSAQNDSVSVGKDAADTNWQIMTRSGTTTTKTDTGVAVAAGGTGNVFDVLFFCKPNDTKITARMVNITTGAVLINNVDLTTNLPTNNVMLTPHFEVRNGAVATAVAGFLNRIYLESDT